MGVYHDHTGRGRSSTCEGLRARRAHTWPRMHTRHPPSMFIDLTAWTTFGAAVSPIAVAMPSRPPENVMRAPVPTAPSAPRRDFCGRPPATRSTELGEPSRPTVTARGRGRGPRSLGMAPPRHRWMTWGSLHAAGVPVRAPYRGPANTAVPSRSVPIRPSEVPARNACRSPGPGGCWRSATEALVYCTCASRDRGLTWCCWQPV